METAVIINLDLQDTAKTTSPEGELIGAIESLNLANLELLIADSEMIDNLTKWEFLEFLKGIFDDLNARGVYNLKSETDTCSCMLSDNYIGIGFKSETSLSGAGTVDIKEFGLVFIDGKIRSWCNKDVLNKQYPKKFSK